MKEWELKIVPSTRVNRLIIHKHPSNILDFISSKRIYINTTKKSVVKLYLKSVIDLKKQKEKQTIFFSF